MRKDLKCLLVLNLEILAAPLASVLATLWFIGCCGVNLGNRQKWQKDIDEAGDFFVRLWNKQWDWIER